MKIHRPELRIVYFGTPKFSALILEKLLNSAKFIIQAVVTSTDKPVGRSQTLTASKVALVAQKHGIPALKPELLDEEFSRNHLSFLDSDLFIVVAYGKILPKELLDIPKYGALNIHYSLLPKYRGSSPIQAAILNGDRISGTSIIKMDEKLDHGPILATKEISLSDQDTFESLNTTMTQATIDLLIQTVADFIAGNIQPQPQNEEQASYTKLITKEDGYFDLPACLPTGKAGRQVSIKFLEKLDRMIRAYYPWPTAWTKWSFDKIQDKIVKFYPGGLIQMEGKKAVKLEEFLRGYPAFPIKRLKS